MLGGLIWFTKYANAEESYSNNIPIDLIAKGLNLIANDHIDEDAVFVLACGHFLAAYIYGGDLYKGRYEAINTILSPEERIRCNKHTRQVLRIY